MGLRLPGELARLTAEQGVSFRNIGRIGPMGPMGLMMGNGSGRALGGVDARGLTHSQST